MATKKKVVKVRDLKPSKDAKGGAGSRQLGGSRQVSGGSRQVSGGSRQLDGTTRQGG